MPNISSQALSLLKEIGGGERMFQTISTQVAEVLGVPDAENMTDAQADEIKDSLEELERSGLIVIAVKSGAGFYTIDRITGLGQDILRSMKR